MERLKSLLPQPSLSINDLTLMLKLISSDFQIGELQCFEFGKSHLIQSFLILLTRINPLKEFLENCKYLPELTDVDPALIGETVFNRYVEKAQKHIFLRTILDSIYFGSMQSAYDVFVNTDIEDFIIQNINDIDESLASPYVPIDHRYQSVLFADNNFLRFLFDSEQLYSQLPFTHVYKMDASFSPQETIYQSIDNHPFLSAPEAICFTSKEGISNFNLPRLLYLPTEANMSIIKSVASRVKAWSQADLPESKDVIAKYQNVFPISIYKLIGYIVALGDKIYVVSQPIAGKNSCDMPTEDSKLLLVALYAKSNGEPDPAEEISQSEEKAETHQEDTKSEPHPKASPVPKKALKPLGKGKLKLIKP